MLNKNDVIKVLDQLEETYPEAECALHHRNNFELIVAVSLSAQTTDKSVNRVTPALFERFPNAFAMAEAKPEQVAEYIRTIGMYRNKSKNVVNMSKMLVEGFNGQVPEDYDALVSLPGVGRKTANVVLSVGFGQQRIAVDTHVYRVSNRLGIVEEKGVLATEKALMARIPENRWSKTHHSLIFHGRNCCKARKPECESCPVQHICEKKTPAKL